MFTFAAVGLVAFFLGLLVANIWPASAEFSAHKHIATPPKEWVPPWVGPRFRCANCKCKWCVLGEET